MHIKQVQRGKYRIENKKWKATSNSKNLQLCPPVTLFLPVDKLSAYCLWFSSSYNISAHVLCYWSELFNLESHTNAHLSSRIQVPASCWMVLISVPKFWICVACENSCAMYHRWYLLIEEFSISTFPDLWNCCVEFCFPQIGLSCG